MIGDFFTERLALRPMRTEDLDLLVELHSDPEVMEFVGWVGAIPSPAGEEYDVGWRFRRAAWGRGFATEAARELIDRLFAIGAQRVFAQTMVVNTPSRAVMKRLGLRHSQTFLLQFEDPLPGTELGEVEYEPLCSEWDARPG